MRTEEHNKITSELFRKDIRTKDFNKGFEKIFKIKVEDFLSDYEYDEIDEFPIEMEGRGIMIGFAAETIKMPPQVEYVDIDVYKYPLNIDYLVKKIPTLSPYKKSEDIEEHLAPFENLRIYYSLDDLKQLDRVIFEYEGLRYELSVNRDAVISRIRVCFAENESSINMRTYYLFDNG